ncbi:MAG: hypothetical protein LBE12_19490 [Planctomycetaceae bacterium]|nr:hypothetical protein [Planctomycetaceae bacterium]
MIIESAASGVIAVWVVICLRHSQLSTFHSPLLFCPYGANWYIRELLKTVTIGNDSVAILLFIIQ